MNPTGLFLIIFVGAPLLELYVLIEVGSQIGASWTILLSILTAALGGWLVRTQGFAVAFRAQQQIQQGAAPTLELMEGATLLMVGFALLLPGFITDVIGFLLLITPVRRQMMIRILQQRGILQPGRPATTQTPTSSHYIEGEFRREDS
ncbi:MAG: FxsA family protein [Pseudomonadota bacterium]